MTNALRSTHESWLHELTAIPTATGREHRVIAWIERWVAQRSDLALRADDAGNLVIERADAATSEVRPLFITAHLDHPAFVVESVDDDTLKCTFRGGVRDCYFKSARLVVFVEGDNDRPVRARVRSTTPTKPLRTVKVRIQPGEDRRGIKPGDIGRWDLPEPSVQGDVFFTHACDDLAAVAAALAAMDGLRGVPEAAHVRLLFTRAEEIGFVGAIAACKLGTIPEGARVVLLENSRSFDDSPIGGGPIVRVGDRMSVFNADLTAGISGVAAKLAKDEERAPGDAGSTEWITSGFRWQRKLMPGGACESTCYQAYGYESACLCLPLGNYHNMADLALVLAGDADAIDSAQPGREHIALADFHGLITLLIGCGTGLDDLEPIRDKMEALYAERKFVLR